MNWIFTLVFLAFPAFAETPSPMGAISGGGGKGVVCRASDNKIKSVQLLDLWEAETLHNETPAAMSGDVPIDVSALIQRLKNAYAFSGSCGLNVSDQDCVAKFMENTAQQFYGSSPNVLRLRGVTLTLTDDSYEMAKPVDCGIEQIVNFQPSGQILVNQDLYEKMDEVNQVALIAHESLYSLLREAADETSSIRTRRAVGYSISGGTYKIAAVPATMLHCRSAESPRAVNELDFYHTTVNGKAGVGFYFNRLRGSQLMGIGDWQYTFLGDANSDPWMQTLLTGKCTPQTTGGYFEATVSFAAAGPIENSRVVRVGLDCSKSTKPGIYLVGGNIMSDDQTQFALTCD